MLPFPQLVQYNNVISNAIVDIDFSTYSTGSNPTIINSANSDVFQLETGTVPSIVTDAEIGTNVLQLTSACKYFITMNDHYNLVNKNWRMTIVFKSNNSTSLQTLLSTGGYPSLDGRIPGLSLSINQYPSTYVQLFCDPGSTFNRVLIQGTNTQSWETITITRRIGVGISTFSSITGVTENWPDYGYGIGSQLALFASVPSKYGLYGFTGLVQKLLIEKL